MNLHLLIRGVADNLGRGTYSIGNFDHTLFHGLPTIWLQHWLGTSNPFIVSAAILLHSSWFFVPLALALYVQVRCGWSTLARLVALHLALLFLADCIYVLLPTRPPWMDMELTRVVGHASATRFDDNAFASFPSLHVAVPVLYAVWFLRQRDIALRRMGPYVALWALGITWAVVYSGEHYLSGCIASAALAGVVCLVGTPVIEKIANHRRTTRVVPKTESTPAQGAGLAAPPAFRTAVSLERVRNQYD